MLDLLLQQTQAHCQDTRHKNLEERRRVELCEENARFPPPVDACRDSYSFTSVCGCVGVWVGVEFFVSEEGQGHSQQE